jgi:hypothetical protein
MKIVYRFFKKPLFKSQKEKLHNYHYTFNKDYGRFVLADLLKEMNFYTVAKEDTQFENGKRFVCQYILNMLNMKAEEVQDIDNLTATETILGIEEINQQ